MWDTGGHAASHAGMADAGTDHFTVLPGLGAIIDLVPDPGGVFL